MAKDRTENQVLLTDADFGRIRRMSEPILPLPAAAQSPRWNADLVFAALGDPVRRRILQVLADGKPRTATDLKGSARRRLDATLKHLVALRAGGLVVTQANPVDGRRQLYTLSPHVTVMRNAAGGIEMDFGLCVVRC